MSFKEFTKSLNKDGAEGELLKTVLISLVTSFLIIGLLYFFKLRYIENFIPKYGFYLFFIVLSYAIILPSVFHIKAYKEFACMSGMMVGMTIGMLAGFLIGYYIGATNGMFWGSVVGMAVGIFLGAWNGKCCGVMGIMEGVMAGLMGGLMGAMTAVMMLNDHLKAAGVIVFVINAAISIGLNYMIHKEMKGVERENKQDIFLVILLSLILTAITIWFMVFGPRSALFN